MSDLRNRIMEAEREEQSWREQRVAMEEELKTLTASLMQPTACMHGSGEASEAAEQNSIASSSRRKKAPKKSIRMTALAAGAGLFRMTPGVRSAELSSRSSIT
jgi:hypothetical protein